MSRPYERPAAGPGRGTSPHTGRERRQGAALAGHLLTTPDAPGRGGLPRSDIRPGEGGGLLTRMRGTGGALIRIAAPRG
ncbi:hypothetical protein ABZ719_06485 [Streptomyces sp. NPDC006743]|uniref:hypothetical protein n=1 Tax=Streptomyces sp. NPDC006743 TaxID=3154480 RepID=UPI0034512258